MSAAPCRATAGTEDRARSAGAASGVLRVPRATIMVVESDDGERAAIVAALTQKYDVLEAPAAIPAAWQLAAYPTPDLIVCSVELRDVDGCTFARRVRSHPKRTRVPLIFLIREKDAVAMIRAIAAGARHCVEKPVHMPRLLEQVDRTLSWSLGKKP